MNYNAVLENLERIKELYEQYVYLKKKERKKIRRWWAKPHIRFNYLSGYGGLRTIFHYFKLNDEEEFINFTRFSVDHFNYLYELVKPHLIKRSKRPPLPPELRFGCVLNYLAAGDSIKKNGWFYTIGESTVYSIIPEVCKVIFIVLGPIFLRPPSTNDMERIAEEYYDMLDFPHCLGSIDGRHCPIKQPPHSAAAFFNYKKFYSIVLMAICDAHKRFMFINLGGFGSMNDAGLFNTGDICQGIEDQSIKLPVPRALPNTDTILPFFFIGDGGFPCKNYLLKPFLKTNQMTVPMRVFNFRLSRARYIIEGAFGLLSTVWRVNQMKLEWALPTTESIILATICLHNSKITLDLRDERGYIDHWIDSALPCNVQLEENQHEFQMNMNAFQLRNEVKDYLVSPAGAVPYQWQYI